MAFAFYPVLQIIRLPFLGPNERWGREVKERMGLLWANCCTSPTEIDVCLWVSKISSVETKDAHSAYLRVWASPHGEKGIYIQSAHGPQRTCQKVLHFQDHLSDSPISLPCPANIWDSLEIKIQLVAKKKTNSSGLVLWKN